MMTSAQVVETSVNVTSNSPSQDYTHPDDHNLPNYNNNNNNNKNCFFWGGGGWLLCCFITLILPSSNVLSGDCYHLLFTISQQLTLKDTRSLPVQVDGEPWEEGPCVITITHHNQALMLARQEKDLVA